MTSRIDIRKLTLTPLSKQNWHAFVDLFGERGACGNCWCMALRSTPAEFEKGKLRDGNKRRMRRLVVNNAPTGLLGMYDGKAIAWCAFAPREDFVKLERSRVHKRIDDLPVWSVPCFFIRKEFRKQGVSVAMLKGIIAHATKKKIKAIEAYPVIPTEWKLPDTFAWVGLYKSFERAGFQIVDRTSRNRPTVRYYLP